MGALKAHKHLLDRKSSLMAQKLSGKLMRDAFFKEDEDDPSNWTCCCGAKRRVKGSGYSNFISHIQALFCAKSSNLL